MGPRTVFDIPPTGYFSPIIIIQETVGPVVPVEEKKIITHTQPKLERIIKSEVVDSLECIEMIWPVASATRTSQGYKRNHPALDISYADSGNTDLPIVAVSSGVVIQAERGGWNGGYGNVIVIDHGDGWQTRYAHNSTVMVEVGDTVEQGQQIAVMGNTGRVHGVTGIHLHFEVIKEGRRMNPATCF